MAAPVVAVAAAAAGPAPDPSVAKPRVHYADCAPRTPWWLSSDAEHAHTACPLRPFAHMVVALPGAQGPDGAEDGGTWAIDPPVAAAQLSAARVVHLSDALRRKMRSIAPDVATDTTVGDMLALAAGPASGCASPSGVGAGLWHMLGWLVGTHDDGFRARGGDSDSSVDASGDQHMQRQWRHEQPYRRRRHARVPEDDPLLVGNEGLGAVELAATRSAKHNCMFALCAHALSPTVQAEWRAWHAQTALALPVVGAGQQLAVVHVAEVSTLHRVACHGVDQLVPPALPLEQQFAHMLDSGRALGPPPALPPLLRPDARPDTPDSAIRWMSLLVSRHGLVEMAYPLSSTRIAPLADDPALDTGPPVALGSYLGESVFSRIHPEDVARVVKALRLAWDARPDVYHFSRLRREWQRRRLSTATVRPSASAPTTPPLRPQRAATLAFVSGGGGGGMAPTLGSRLGVGRQVHHQDGIEVANGVVELNIQLQLSGAVSAIDWDDAEATSEHTRFARMKLTRWPLIVKPPRVAGGAHHGADAEEPQDGFILAAVRPLPEPSRMRSRSPGPAGAGARGSGAKRSISSVTSTSTLVGAHSVSALESAELVRLCRSTSSLSCQETTARPSIELTSAVPRAADFAVPGATPIPLARPVVGLSNNAVHTATAMSPHLSMRRRSNIPVGSHPTEDGLAARAFGAFAY
ncbi:hypothetical protein LPJ61_002876 [Coemansia biformis]|uniref:Uncharacterized protein n=1 Tax=Coemansia biformis TaxID=1286918 RepID=A0A9W7Y7K0_9FUNG|nr:hypothetical protein LPJ61_002876 [Coemansia biformis]